MSSSCAVQAAPERRSTSRRTAVLLGVLLSAAMVARVPSLYAALERDFPAAMAAELGDPQLQALALRVGLAIGLLVSVLAVAVFLFLARRLEAAVFPRTTAVLGVPLGLHTAVYAGSALLGQLASLLWPVAVATTPLVHLACAMAALGGGTLLLAGPLRRAPVRSRAVAVVSAALLAVLASWNWLP